jgi:hypothetical protein
MIWKTYSKEVLKIFLNSISGFCFVRKLWTRRHDTQHNDIQYNDTHHNDIHHNDTQRNDILHTDAQHNNKNPYTQHNGTQCCYAAFLCWVSLRLKRIVVILEQGVNKKVSASDSTCTNIIDSKNAAMLLTFVQRPFVVMPLTWRNMNFSIVFCFSLNNYQMLWKSFWLFGSSLFNKFTWYDWPSTKISCAFYSRRCYKMLWHI